MGDYHRYKPRDFQFAQRLLTLRMRAGLTQEDIALQMSVAEKTIRNWEGGSNYPSDVHLRKLTELYLTQNAFTAGSEQDEVHALWDQLRESTPRRTGIFDEQWFATLFQKWQACNINHAQQATNSSMNPPYPASRLLRGDWSEALDMSALYGRTEELAELERWLRVDQCRVVAILGMGGIGKTTLAVKLVQQVTPHFDCVLWRSLHNAPILEDVLLDWIPAISEQRYTQPPQDMNRSLALFIKLLQDRRCLLVLDNLETLFQEGVFEGQYREGYEGYATLIRRVAETKHQSCLLLTCRELFPGLGVFTGSHAPMRTLRLSGLALPACQQLLQDKELFGKLEVWSDLARGYGGNPLALKIVGEMVCDLFSGDIAAFLDEGLITFHGIHQLLTQQFERLSALEQALMYWLAIERELTPLEALRADLQPSITTSEVLEAMHSLLSRSLVERGERGAVFTLQPVVLEYVTNRLITLVCEEIRTSKPVLLLTHALLQGQAKDYIRTSQARLIVQPILDKLVTHLGSTQGLEAQLENLLQQFRGLPPARQGYGGGNVVNLLVRLNGHVNGKDCSRLTIWQANLQGAEAHDANFAGSDLTSSVFMETIDGICSVALSPNGEYVAGGSNNGEIRLWRATDGQPLLAIQGHIKLAWSLTFNAESTLLVSGGYDGLVKVWEVSSGLCVSILPGHSKWIGVVTFHPEGKLLATCSDDRSIRLWDLQAGHCVKVWYEEHLEVWTVAFSPDGLLLASGGSDGIVKIWELASEQCLWSAAAHHGSYITSLAFSPNGELLVSGGTDATIVVWEASTGKHLSTLSGHIDEVQSVKFNEEGVLASSSYDYTVKLWQIGREEDAWRCVDTLQGHTGLVWSVNFGPRNLLVSGSHDGVVKLWQISRGGEGGKCLWTLRGYPRLINTVALSPDGELLVSDESKGAVRMWDTRSGQCLRVFSKQAGESSAAAFSPDGRLFVNSLPDKTINIWEVDSGQYLSTLKGHQGESWSVVFSANGRFLVSGSIDTTIKWWEVESGRCIATFRGHKNWIWSVACSPDGTLLASGDIDGVVKVWEIGSGQCLHTLQGSPKAIPALTFTPDSTQLLTSNEQDLVTVWDVKSGHCLRTVPGTGETYWLHSVAFSADGSLLATASSDQTVKLWDVGSGELLRKFSCHPGRPWSVAFSADQRLLASVSDDGTIILWERQTGKRLMALHSDRPYERMNITGVTCITEAQKASLKILGAIDEPGTDVRTFS